MDDGSIAAQLFSFLGTELGLDLSAVDADTKLFTSGVLNSLDVLRLAMFIEQTYSINISPFEISIDKFDTVARITEFVRQKKT